MILEKLVKEANELIEKINKLKEFFNKEEFLKLDDEMKDLLIAQHSAMNTYLSILSARIGYMQRNDKYE